MAPNQCPSVFPITLPTVLGDALRLSPSTVGSPDWFPEWLRIKSHRLSQSLFQPYSEFHPFIPNEPSELSAPLRVVSIPIASGCSLRNSFKESSGARTARQEPIMQPFYEIAVSHPSGLYLDTVKDRSPFPGNFWENRPERSQKHHKVQVWASPHES